MSTGARRMSVQGKGGALSLVKPAPCPWAIYEIG